MILSVSKTGSQDKIRDEKTNHTFIRVDTNEDEIKNGDYSDVEFGLYDAVISDYNKGFLSRFDIQYICDNHPGIHRHRNTSVSIVSLYSSRSMK